MHIGEQTFFPLPLAKKSILLNRIIIPWLSNSCAIVSQYSGWHWLLNLQHKILVRLVRSAVPKWTVFFLTSLKLSLLMGQEKDRARKEVILISLWKASSTYGCLARASHHKLLIRAVAWKNNQSLIFCRFFQIAVVCNIKQSYIHVSMLNKF